MTKEQSRQKTARVVAQYRGKYRVRCGQDECWAEVTGKMMFTAENQSDYPVVGDMVTISETGPGQAQIQAIMPRKTLLQRKAAGKDAVQPIAANINVAFIVQAVDRDFNLNRFERYLTIVSKGKIEPIIVLNKIDLISRAELDDKIAQIKDRFQNIKVLTTSAEDNSGIKGLAKAIKKGKEKPTDHMRVRGKKGQATCLF